MSNTERLLKRPLRPIRDLPNDAVIRAKSGGVIAWDIETSGLDWKTDYIGTCQLYLPNYNVYVIQVNGTPPPQLKALLSDVGVRKIFHHAMFDLRFMVYHWSVIPQNIVCTKIASKILNPSEEDHSLKALLERYLGIILNKELRRSNWLRDSLSQEQVNYAANDVIHLPQLYDLLQRQLLTCRKLQFAKSTFAYIPTRAQLDTLGYGDLFQY